VPFTDQAIETVFKAVVPKFFKVTFTFLLPMQNDVEGLSTEAIPASGGMGVNSSAPISGLDALRVCPSMSSLIVETGVAFPFMPAALTCRSEVEVYPGSSDTELASIPEADFHAARLL
jgi:hypothetical protein